MKVLKAWGWILFGAFCFCDFYNFVYGPSKISNMDNAGLIVETISIVCLLLAITVWVIAYALKQNNIDK